jgi:hypothetical protein
MSLKKGVFIFFQYLRIIFQIFLTYKIYKNNLNRNKKPDIILTGAIYLLWLNYRKSIYSLNC